jgi:biotin operon repressor
MTSHPSAASGLSQCDLILAVLERHAGAWVSLLDLAAASGSMAVHSRIADLRTRGKTIEHKNDRKGRTVHSSYRLLKPAAVQIQLL